MSSKVPKPTELIPDNEKIVGEAMASLPSEMKKPQYIEKNFYKVLRHVMTGAMKFF